MGREIRYDIKGPARVYWRITLSEGQVNDEGDTCWYYSLESSQSGESGWQVAWSGSFAGQAGIPPEPHEVMADVLGVMTSLALQWARHGRAGGE